VKLAKSKDSLVDSSRLAKMWADQCRLKPDPIIETNTRGLKRKLFNPVGGLVKAARMDKNSTKQDQPAEIETELNKVQLNKEHLYKNKDAAFKSLVLPPAGQSVATGEKFRVWRGRPTRDQVSKSEARVHSKCILCADFGRIFEHSNICICAEWGQSNNDQPQLRQANKGIKIMPGLLFSNMSNARGHTCSIERQNTTLARVGR